MSHHYLQLWETQFKNLLELNVQDENFTSGGPYIDLKAARVEIGIFLIRYSLIANKISEIADEIRDPLYMELVKKVYELTVSRVLHLHFELTRLLSEDISILHDLLLQLNLTPYDIQLRLPFYLISEREQRIRERNEWFVKISKSPSNDGSTPKGNESVHSVLNSRVESMGVAESDREIVNKQLIEDLETIVVTENNQEIVSEQLTKDLASRIKTLEIRQAIERNLEKMYKDVSSRIRIDYYKLEEMIEDEITEWIESFFGITGDFPPFPSKDNVFATSEIYGVPKKIPQDFLTSSLGNNSFSCDLPNDPRWKEFVGIPKLSGSELIVNNNWISPDQWNQCKTYKNGKKAKEKKKAAKVKTISKKFRGFTLEKTEYFFIMSALKLKVLAHLTEDIETSITSEVIVELRLRARSAVDDFIRTKLNKYSGKKQKNRETKIKKKKNGGKKRSVEDCMQELADYGILKQIPNHYLYSCYGDGNIRVLERFSGEMLHLLQRRCVFPLLSSTIHRLSPLTRSICLLGSANSGANFLVDALVTETASAFFDLGPTVMANIPPGKKKLNKLVTTIARVARELEPSIILVSDVEKVFYKKVPRAEKKTNPQRLQKALPKLIKGVSNKDQIMIVGISTKPWLAKRKVIIKSFDTFIHVSTNNYDTHNLAWQKLLHNVEKPMAVPSLAKTSAQAGCSYFDLKATISDIQTVTDIKSIEEITKVLVKLPTSQVDNHYRYDGFLQTVNIAKAKARNKKNKRKNN